MRPWFVGRETHSGFTHTPHFVQSVESHVADHKYIVNFLVTGAKFDGLL